MHGFLHLLACAHTHTHRASIHVSVSLTSVRPRQSGITDDHRHVVLHTHTYTRAEVFSATSSAAPVSVSVPAEVREHGRMAAHSDSLSVIHYWRRQSIQFICTYLASTVEPDNTDTTKWHNISDSTAELSFSVTFS